MAKKALERHMHIRYTPLFVQEWKYQSQAFRDYCDNLGAPYGYSGMNVFYFFFMLWWDEKLSGIEFKPWCKNREGMP